MEEWEKFADYLQDSNKSKKKVRHQIAEFIATEFDVKTMRDSKEVYFYQDGVYLRGGKDKLEKLLVKNLGSYLSGHARTEILRQVKIMTYSDREELEPASHLINVENGVLDIKERSLMSHSPEYFFTTKLPVTYNPDAECPEIKQFFHEIVEGRDVGVLEEMIGYCLLRDYPKAKAFLLLGDGANGKSTLISLIEEFLGEDNYSSLPLQKIGQRFQTRYLYGKLANMDADLSSKSLHDLSVFKRATGDDTLFADVKNKDAFEFVNYAKLIFSANQYPSVKSSDPGFPFYRRWIVIRFPYNFTDKDDQNPDADPLKKERITTQEELSGLLNIAIEGLHRVMEDGFSYDRNVEAMWEGQDFDDPWEEFYSRHLTDDFEWSIKKQDLQDVINLFCKINGYPELSARKITSRLEEKDRFKSKTQHEGEQFRIWNGLKLKGIEGLSEISEKNIQYVPEIQQVDFDSK
jgi:P4 family phage/plasmid primase-like protien